MAKRIKTNTELMQRVIKMLPEGIGVEAIESVEVDNLGGVDGFNGYWVYLNDGYISPEMGCHTIHEDTLTELADVVGSIEVWADDPDLIEHKGYTTYPKAEAQEGETMNGTTNATKSMTYFEARETYAELFKKYPEVSGVFTDNEDKKSIIYWCENYEKHGSRWELVDITEERINYVFYYNVVDPRASRFMRNLGGYERTTVNYTKRGYIPTECVSISPDRTAKTVRRFEFI